MKIDTPGLSDNRQSVKELLQSTSLIKKTVFNTIGEVQIDIIEPIWNRSLGWNVLVEDAPYDNQTETAMASNSGKLSLVGCGGDTKITHRKRRVLNQWWLTFVTLIIIISTSKHQSKCPLLSFFHSFFYLDRAILGSSSCFYESSQRAFLDCYK